MKRILLALILITSLFNFVPALAASVNDTVDCSAAPSSSFCASRDATGGDPLFGSGGVVTKVTQLVTIAAGAIAIIMTLWGGLKFINSAGDSAKVNTAKNTVLYGLIGLGIALMAQSIIVFILRRL